MCETLFLILCVRKKFQLNRECPSTTILTEFSSGRIKQISDKKKIIRELMKYMLEIRQKNVCMISQTIVIRRGNSI